MEPGVPLVARRLRYTLAVLLAGVVLVVSFIPDLWLLTESGAASFPGATPAGVGTLMLMHVVSAAAVVWAVERSG